MNQFCESDKAILEDYLKECKQLLKSGFKPKKIKAFTSKFINRQLNAPKLPSKILESDLTSFKKLSAMDIQRQILSGETTYAEVVMKYHKIKANHKNANNLLTWSRFEEPFKRATQIDEEIKSLSPEQIKEKYPLLGFVMSLKDCLYAKDTPTTGGLFINLDRVASEQPETIQNMKNSGMVFTSKGNVPQMLFAFETENNLYGEAVHAHDSSRTVGGSSGGDAALLFQSYNNSSIGSDIGGSLRIPALFNGICSLKPTSKRLSRQCQANFFSRNFGSDQVNPQSVKTNRDVQFVIPVTIGPMAKKTEDLERIMKVLVKDQSFEMTIPPLPWKENISFPKKIGIIREHKLCELGPTAKRVMQESENALRKAGYELFDLDVKDLLTEIAANTIMAFNKNNELFSVINGKTNVKETFGKLFSLAKLVHSLPLWVVKIVKWKEGDSRKGFILENFLKSKQTSTQDINEVQSKCYKEIERKMRELNLSAILSPGMPMPAIKLGISNKCFLSCLYMFIWNFLDMPSGVITVGNVKENEQFYDSEFDDEMSQILKENAIGSEGMPMGVSITSRVFNEEVVIQIMKDLENNLN